MDSSNMGFDDDISLTDYIKENIKRPFFFHQHHFYTNFTKYVYYCIVNSMDSILYGFDNFCARYRFVKESRSKSHVRFEKTIL